MSVYQIVFTAQAVEEAARLDSPMQKRVRSAIDAKLTTDPLRFGKPLRHALAGARGLRVGDWRVVYTVREGTVYITALFHRSGGYEH